MQINKIKLALGLVAGAALAMPMVALQLQTKKRQ
jgi:hypothetical protein